MRFSYPENGDAYLIVDCFNNEGNIEVHDGMVEGFSTFYAKNNSATLPEDFATHFVISSSLPVTQWDTLTVDSKLCAWLLLDTKDSRIAEIKIASSFINQKQALLNYQREVEGNSFDTIYSKAKKLWHEELSKLSVKGGSPEQLRTFYSTLYRTKLFPRELYEFDEQGNPVHFDFYNGGRKDGYMFADNGFWDTFRSVHPLFTITNPH